jgi:hypothetical protein
MKRHRAQLPTRDQVQRAQSSGMASDILTLNAGSSTLKFSLWQSGTRISLPGGLVARR